MTTHRLRQISAAAFIAAAAATAAPAAFAGGGGFMGATESTQLLNHAELISQLAEQVQQTATQISQLQNMLQNSVNIPIQMWQSVASPISDLINAVSNTEAIVNASAGALTQVQQQFGDSNSLLSGYSDRLVGWNKGINQSIGTTLQQMGLTNSRFITKQSALQALEDASKNSNSRMAVLQAANQISGMLVNEMQDLHATMISAEQAKLNYLAAQENRTHQNELMIQKVWGTGQMEGFF